MSEKQKIEGVDNKELKAFFAIIVAIVLLLIFEIFFFKGRPEIAEENAKYEEELLEKQNFTVAAEQKNVYKVVNQIVEKLNTKDYEWIYDNLKDDYKNYYFRNYDDFKGFIDLYASTEYYPKYGSYYRDGDLYYIMVDFLLKEYTREDLLSPETTKVDTIVLEEQADGNFKFAMNGFVEYIYHNSSKTVEGVTFTLLDSIRNTETMETTVVVTNNSDSSLMISTSNLQPNIMGGNSAKLSTTDLVIIQPGETETLAIEYYMQYNSGKTFNGLTITGVGFSNGIGIEDILLPR